MTATLTKTRTYHLVTEFAVTFNDIPDEQIVGNEGVYPQARNETWEYHIQQVARALWVNPAILDRYLAFRSAWHLMLELGAEGDDLCRALDVPSDTGELFPLLLGLHLPPTTRGFLKDMHARKGRDDDTPYFFHEAIEKVIVVAWTVADHHLAHAAD